MKQSKFSKTHVVNILKEAEAGISMAELSRKCGFGKSAFYKGKAKYSDMDGSALKQLEEENRRLKQMHADLSLEHLALKDIV